MSLKKSFNYSIVVLSLFVFAGTAAAQTAEVPRLTMNATVETTLRLDISSHASGVVGTGTANDFVVNLGTINGLGLGTPATGVSKSVSGSGAASVATYTTPIVLTPVFSGYAGLATIALSVGGGANDATAVEGNSHALATLAAARSVVVGSETNAANTRYVGFQVAQTEVAGARAAMFLYTITMP